MLKLSLMTCQLWNAWSHETYVRQVCEFARELGLDGIDWITTSNHDPREIRKISDDCGIKTVCYTFFGELERPDAAVRARAFETALESLEIAEILGADKIMIAMGGHEGFPRQEARRHAIAGLSCLAPRARAAGITITVEHFPTVWAPFITSADVNAGIAAVPDLRVTFDNGNSLFGGEQSVDAYLRSKEYIVHAHFKDWVWAATGRKTLEGKFLEPALMGEGIIDHRACLQAMADAGYNGYINFEYEGNKYNSLDAARKGVRYLRGLYETVRPQK